MTYDTEDNSAPVFTNEYYASIDAEFEATKAENADLRDNDFTFELYEGENKLDSKTVKQGETATFEKIEYDQDDDGKTFNYTIKEVIPTDATKNANGKWELNGIIYDDNVYTVTVEITDNHNGTMSKTVTYQTTDGEAPVFKNTYDASGKIRFAGTKIIEGRYFTDLDTMVVCITDNDSKESIEQEILSFTPGETAQQFVMDATFDYSLEDIGGAGKRKTFTYTAEEKEVSMFGTTPRSEKHEVEVTVADNYTGTLIIEEVTVDGVKVEYDDAIEAFGGIEFINTYHTEDEVQIKAEKELKGMTLKPGAFTFTLTAGDDVVALIGDSAKQTKTNDEYGIVEFDKLIFAVNPTPEQIAEGYVDIADLPMVNGHYEFTMILAEDETGLADRNIRISGVKQYTITVNVDYNPKNGVLKATIKPDDQEFKFTNLKNAKADIDVGAQKKMLGRDLKDGEFNFTLKGQVTDEYSVDQAKTNDGTGAITFDKLYFAVYPTDAQTTAGYIDVTDKVVDSGEYEIKLKVSEDLAALASKPEVIPVSPMLPDGTMSYDVTITLKYDKDEGTLSAEIDKKMADMVFINRVVKVSKVDIVDEHELPGSLIQIYASSVVAPNGRGEKVCEFVSGKKPTEVTGLHPGTEYILHEELAPNGYLLAADTTFIIDKEDGTITSDALRTSDGVLLIKDDMIKVSATVRKIWDDDDNRDGIRPASIEVVLLRKTEGVDPDDTIPYRKVTLSEANNWIATEKELPMVDSECRNYIYTWQEPAAGTGYTLTSSKMDNGTLTTLTNTHVPEKIPISVKKIWVDNDNALKLRPTSIDVQLYADGQAVGKPITLDKNNDWEYTWKDQDKNVHENGLTREIVYTVAETTVPEGYICTISGSTGKGFVVKNTLDTGKLVIEKEFDITPWEPDGPDDSPIDIPVIKTWNDNGNKDGNRPASVTVRLLANGTEVANAELNAGNNWRYTFTGMPRIDESKEKINYTITEDPVEWYKAEINGFNIRNNYEPELTSVAVTKVWDDNNNVQNQRPASIVMTLSNGMSVELNDQNNWTAQIDNLPTRVNGQPVTYTWTEQRVIGYTKVREVTEGNMTTFTNRIWERPKENNGGKKPKTVGDTVITFEEYETPLGVEIVINHVGDCFD